jgi:DNA-binding MurR/RpiR family transcriptional regulator
MSETSMAARSAFDDRVSAALANLSPAEQRVARLFLERKGAILLESAAQIGARTGTSDATVVRTAQSLGVESLAALREAALADLTGRPTPGGRLRRTLEEAGDGAGGDAGQALKHVLVMHEASLEILRAPSFEAPFARAVEALLAARQRRIFGIGPTAALAEYAALQFNRIGLPSATLSATGIGLADRLLDLRAEDVVLMIAYAPVYREVTVTLDHAERLHCPVLLISDSLEPHLGRRVATVLPVPRGKAGRLSLHGATLVLLEALIVGLAARQRTKAFASLETLVALRGALDKSWLKRGQAPKRGKRPNGTGS